ncbi:hypothetical protein N7326_00010 [Corynebacterium sp. ES2794-CONJ1]|uniref:hypothetical protein n=1 Tax=unclassified Corynebacterium TaxID=2624378 RepID=UPI0021688869|nr:MULTISPECIES: hypothetical protein [unclassified Corynebacterium]MCS4489417.1 hypothetical protein [Corynebacterium sp. ES2775-CONJ]MCS4491228.1 hypothetical protein [Corynebacterium sp. ES2715-CONJ3]MCU9518256.1 hypothetical protein [Corynebacterium sp. ES2794-CONJ1]
MTQHNDSSRNSRRPGSGRQDNGHRSGAPRRSTPQRRWSRDEEGRGRPRDEDRRGRDDERRRSNDRRDSGGDRHSEDDRRGGGDRRHANRAGASRPEKRSFHAQRPGYREERINKRINEPQIPSDLDTSVLDPMIVQDLKVLSKDNADAVAKHLVMAVTWLADDPKLALSHARAAKDRAGRIAVVRETCGIVAYHAGEWKEALSELRAARRMSAGPGLVAVMADCERGLGRPAKAIELAREEHEGLDRASQIELAIVVAGARSDLGQIDSAVTTLQQENPDPRQIDPAYARLSYAYADALAQVGRTEEAIEWFSHADKQDVDRLLDADERLRELS